MPFKSKRQLATCFSRQLKAESRGEKWNWDCKRWLEVTPDPKCLPSLKGRATTTVSKTTAKAVCRNLKKGEKIITPIHQGPKGGYYFYAGGVKVYVPKEAVAYAKKKYGVAK